MLTFISPAQRALAHYLFPAVLCGFIAWLTLIIVGNTPLIRATGLALGVIGVSLTLRRLGALFAVAGGLALAYSPAFWLQSGGAESLLPATIVIALAAAGGIVGLFTLLIHRPYLGIGLGLVIFAIIFWSQIGTPRSLRLTGFITAWLVYLLINTLRQTNPRPEDPPHGALDARYPYGILLFLAVGIINDPLFTLLVPAVVLGLLFSKIALPRLYWSVVVVIMIIGVRGIILQYISPYWWTFSAEQADLLNIRVPYLLADGWREASRWVGLINLVVSQFSMLGVALGVIGLARMARWYPTLGVVLMVAYAAYAAFGLMYFGQDRPVLLLPLLIIQIIWMTYAVYSFGQWLQKSTASQKQVVAWVAPAAFTVMPLLMLLEIVRGL